MGRLTNKKEYTSKSAYVEKDCWAIVNKDDFITHIAPSLHKLKVMYVGSFETLEDDPQDIAEQFDQLIDETDDCFVQVEVNYTVERTRIEK